MYTYTHLYMYVCIYIYCMCVQIYRQFMRKHEGPSCQQFPPTSVKGEIPAPEYMQNTLTLGGGPVRGAILTI